MNENPLWASESFWKKVAIWVTAGSFLILVILTFDSLSKTSVGSERVKSYSVINKKIAPRGRQWRPQPPPVRASMGWRDAAARAAWHPTRA